MVDMKSKQVAEIIIEKIMKKVGLKRRKDFASFVNVSSATLSKSIKEGRVPDRWFDVLKEKKGITKAQILSGVDIPKEVLVSGVAYKEASLPQNQPLRTQAEEYDYGYSIPPAEFKRMIAARFDSIFDWLADEFDGSSGALELWMSEFMEKFRIDYPEYRQWLYEQMEKKRLLSTKENTKGKKHVG